MEGSRNFRLTYGLRIDAPSYGNASFKNPNFNPDGTFKGDFQEGSPTIPNNDDQVLFDENGTLSATERGSNWITQSSPQTNHYFLRE